MAESKPQDGHKPLSRLEFLKLGSLALASPAIKGLSRITGEHQKPEEVETKEIKSWKDNRFFENIESLKTDNDFEAVENDLLSFPEKFKDALSDTWAFNLEEWRQSARRPIDLLKRIRTAYSAFPDNPQVKKLLQRDFYKIGSSVWALLRTGEIFKDRPEDFAKICNSKYLVSKYTQTDPFLGDELFSIDADWTASWWKIEPRDEEGVEQKDKAISPVLWLTMGLFDLDSATGYMQSESFWWPKTKGVEGLANYQSDEKIPHRPKEVNLIMESEDPKVRDFIMNLLREHRLNRSLAKLVIYLSPYAFYGGYSDEARDVEATFGENPPTIEEIQQYPHAVKGLIIHEFGHAFHYLIPHLKSDKKTILYRNQMQQLIDELSLYSPLERLFKPEGTHQSRLVKLNGAEWSNQRDKFINFASVTDYPADEYMTSIILDGERMLEQLTTFSELGETDKRWYLTSLFENVATGPTTFEDHYLINIKPAKDRNLDKLQPFEKKLLETIEANLDLFDAPERTFYYRLDEKMDNQKYFKQVVVPAVLNELLVTKPDETIDLILLSIHPDWHKQARHYLKSFVYDLINKYDNSNVEFFAEIFHNALRRHDDGVVVDGSIPESYWGKVDRFIYNVQDDLIEDGLAQFKPSGAVV